jgi:hypothetical protein
MSKQIFISYRRSDARAICERINDSLVRAFGAHEVFRDLTAIAPGADFRLAMEEGLKRAKVVLVLIGSTWLTVTDEAGKRRLDDPLDRVRLEVEQALRDRLVIIPVLVEGAHPLSERDLPESLGPLAYRNAVSVRPDPDYGRDIQALIAEIRDYLPVPVRPNPARQVVGALRATVGFFVSLITFALTVMALGTWFNIPYLTPLVQSLLAQFGR